MDVCWGSLTNKYSSRRGVGGTGRARKDPVAEMSEAELPLEHGTWPGPISSSFLITFQLSQAMGQGPSPDPLWRVVELSGVKCWILLPVSPGNVAEKPPLPGSFKNSNILAML